MSAILSHLTGTLSLHVDQNVLWSTLILARTTPNSGRKSDVPFTRYAGWTMILLAVGITLGDVFRRGMPLSYSYLLELGILLIGSALVLHSYRIVANSIVYAVIAAGVVAMIVSYLPI